MIGQPRIEERAAQQYVGIRVQVPIRELPNTIPQRLRDLFSWLGRQGVGPAGAPFIRYHVIDMERLLDVELGVPVETVLSGDGEIRPGELPAGRYAVLIYTGRDNGIEGNKVLLDWGKEQGLAWDWWRDPNGDAFGARYESFLSDPSEQPDPGKSETEVAIRLADGPTAATNG